MPKQNMFKFEMPESQARNIHKLIDSHKFALKNWIASRVEQGDLEGAQKLVAELREHEELFACFNIDAKYDIAKYVGREVEKNIFVSVKR